MIEADGIGGTLKMMLKKTMTIVISMMLLPRIAMMPVEADSKEAG